MSADFSTSLTRLRELEPDLVVHVLAADVRDLLARDRRELVEVRHRLDQRVDVVGARLVAVVGGARLRARDRAARGEHADAWQRRRRRLSAAPCPRPARRSLA